MADEALRMQAEVVDRFTGPLKALRAQLLDASREGAAHGETIAKGIGKVEGAARNAGQAAQTILNPALAAVGITGLTAGVAVAGISNALSRLSGNLVGLGQLGRETGMAADQLRIFQSVAGKFGISSEQADAGAQAFAKNMRDIRKGVGETMGFLQSQSPVVAQFALKLKGSTNNDEALRMTEEFLEQIPNAVDRGRLAEKLLGSADFGRLGDKHLGAIRDLNAKTAEKLGPLDPRAVESAERYERALGNLRSSMQRVGTAIAMEILPSAERFTTWVDDIASGKRKDLIDGVRGAMRKIGDELAKIDWPGAGKAAEQMLLSTTALVTPLAEGVRNIAAAIRALNEGNLIEGLRRLDGADGSLARGAAPIPGDDRIARNEAADALRKRIGTAREQGGLQADLLKELEERGDKEGAKRLREAMEANSRHLKSLEDELRKFTEQGASVQKSSAEGGAFGGATVQTAAYGGGGGFRRLGSIGGGVGLPGGGSGPGYTGERGPAGTGAGRSFGGGRFNGLGGGSRTPGIGAGDSPPSTGGTPRIPPIGGGAGGEGRTNARAPEGIGLYRPKYNVGDADVDQRVVNTIAGEVSTKNAEGVDAVVNNMMNRVGSKGWGPSGNLLEVARARGQYAGYRRAAPGESEFIRSRIRAIASGGVPDNTGGSNSYRAESYYRGEGRNRTWARTSDIGPNVGGNRYGFVRGARNGPYAPYSEDAVAARRAEAFPRPQEPAGAADGEGWAARERARKDFETRMQKSDERLTASAGRAGVAGMPKIENNGSVLINVLRPGPDTRVSTSASGNLFKDLALRRGRAMERAEGG